MNDSFKDKGGKRQLESTDNDSSENWSKRSKNEGGGGVSRGPVEQMLTTVLLRNTKAKGAAIGKRGNTITYIRARADVAFSISKEDSVEHLGWIKGKPWSIASALIMLSEELANAFDEELKSITLLVDTKNLDNLHGEGGIRVQEIQEQTGCKVFTSPNTVGSSSQKLVEVIGERFDDAIASVMEALSEVDEPITCAYTAGEGGENAIADAWGDLKRDVERRGPRISRPRNEIPIPGQRNERQFGRGGPPPAERWGGEREFRPPMDGPPPPWGGSRGYSREDPADFRRGGFPSNFPERGPPRSRQGPEAIPLPEIPEHQGSGFREERTIFVPTDMISEVIGKGAVNIKQIRERTGAKVAIEKGKAEDFSELKLIVSGGHESIARASAMIHAFSNT